MIHILIYIKNDGAFLDNSMTSHQGLIKTDTTRHDAGPVLDQ